MSNQFQDFADDEEEPTLRDILFDVLRGVSQALVNDKWYLAKVRLETPEKGRDHVDGLIDYISQYIEASEYDIVDGFMSLEKIHEEDDCPQNDTVLWDGVLYHWTEFEDLEENDDE